MRKSNNSKSFSDKSINNNQWRHCISLWLVFHYQETQQATCNDCYNITVMLHRILTVSNGILTVLIATKLKKINKRKEKRYQDIFNRVSACIGLDTSWIPRMRRWCRMYSPLASHGKLFAVIIDKKGKRVLSTAEKVSKRKQEC